MKKFKIRTHLCLRLLALPAAILTFFLLESCDDNEPTKEDTPELITRVQLVFTPAAGLPVTVTATDPDGEGVQNIQPDGPILLEAAMEYTLSISLYNALVPPGDPGYNLTAEVQDEADEHILFFGWTGNVFSSPAGDGNIDNRADPVLYADEDGNGLPLGLLTDWTAGAASSSGTFRILLKHQPSLKTASSGSSVGETDLDVSFSITIE